MRHSSFIVTALTCLALVGVAAEITRHLSSPTIRSRAASVLAHDEADLPAGPTAADASEDRSALTALLDSVAASLIADHSSLARELRTALHRVRAQPAQSDHWVRLADALVQRSRDTLDASLYAGIERLYLEARRLDASNTDALAGLAWAAGAAHRFEDSVAWATIALQRDPELPDAHGILGDAAIERGDYAAATLHYQQMLDLRPDLSSYSRAAHLLFLQGETARALDLMHQALRAGGPRAEHTAWCVAELTRLLCASGDAPAALALTQHHLARAPEHPLLLAAAARAHLAAGDAAGALPLLERSVALAPQHDTLVLLHDLHRAAGDEAAAAALAQRVHQLHATHAAQGILGGEGSLALFLADRGDDLAGAVRLAEQERAHHHTAAALDTLAWAYHRAGRPADAQRAAAALLEFSLPDPTMLFHAGLIALDAGDTAAAQRHLATALQRAPHFHPVHAATARTILASLPHVTSGSPAIAASSPARPFSAPAAPSLPGMPTSSR